jgi:hypothetical protein
MFRSRGRVKPAFSRKKKLYNKPQNVYACTISTDTGDVFDAFAVPSIKKTLIGGTAENDKGDADDENL